MTTATAEETATPEVSPMRQRLAAAAARTGTTTRRKTAARKAAPRKATAPKSRNERASARGQHGKRIAPLIKAGASLLAGRDPVAARIIQNRADPFCASLDAVAAEDPRVDAFLNRLASWAGKGGAWGELGRESAIIAGGLMLSGGRVTTGPGGMVLAMFAGAVVEQATVDVAHQLAEREAVDAGRMDSDGYPVYTADRVREIAAELVAQRAERAARATVVDEDQGDAPEPDASPSPFAAWGQ